MCHKLDDQFQLVFGSLNSSFGAVFVCLLVCCCLFEFEAGGMCRRRRSNIALSAVHGLAAVRVAL